MCPQGPSTTSCGSCPKCQHTCPCACLGTTATWASTASSCPTMCATSWTAWTGGPTPAPRHTRAPPPGRSCPRPWDAPVPLDRPAAPPLATPPPPAAGPLALLETDLGRVRTEQPQGAGGMSPPSLGPARVQCTERPCRARRPQRLVWASTGGRPAEHSRLNLTSPPGTVGPSTAGRRSAPGHRPQDGLPRVCPRPRGSAPRCPGRRRLSVSAPL